MVIDLPERTCQFHGGRRDSRGLLVFCGKPVKPGYAYCAEHYRRIYQRAPSVALPPRVLTDAAAETPEAVGPEAEREAA